MPWQPGESGNPNGRPRKGKALTEILEQAGSKTFPLIDGKRMSGKRLVARQIWDALATGKIEFIDGSQRRLTVRDWRELAEWLYDRVDGRPMQKSEITGKDGGPQEMVLTWPDGGIAETP
jgi:hypothetical protein